MSKDYYKTLGVPRTASSDEIKKAFRRLAHKYHPDKATGDKKAAEEKFKEAAEAYEVLSDPQKKSAYDQFGESGAPGFGKAGTGFSGFQADHGNFEGFGDIFETFFGNQSSRSSRSHKGQDLEVSLKVTFKEAIFGKTVEFKLTRPQRCEKCSGSGIPPGTNVRNCQTCHGSGEVNTTRQTIFGSIRQVAICRDCQGEGQIPEQRCANCTGTGRVTFAQPLKVKIPPGIENGAVIRLAEQGAAGFHCGPSGDLFIQVVVGSDPKFERRGADIFSAEKIALPLAVLGGATEIETVAGKVKLKIPAGTQSHQVFKMKGHGARKLSSSETGNHFVKVLVEIPRSLSRTEKKLWKELEQAAGKKGFFG